MREQIDKVYQFKELSGYTLKERVLIRLAGWIFYALIIAICKTIRITSEGTDYRNDAAVGHKVPIICAWHDRIFAGMYYLRHRGLVAMSSISFDAEYTARCIQRLGFGVVKGSSTRGGTRALVEMIRMMRRGVPSIFTIDGPRGPRYQVKPGPPLLAKQTGSPIIPMGLELKNHWTLKSWDKMQIPRPFTRAMVFFGDPIFVSSDANEAELEQKRLELQRSLDALVEKGKVWASGL